MYLDSILVQFTLERFPLTCDHRPGQVSETGTAGHARTSLLVAEKT
jgi:hypothetical protein